MSIRWDNDQVHTLAEFVQQKLPLQHGTMSVCMGDVPESCFAGTVNLDGKEFITVTGMDMTLYELAVNVILSYTIALAYDETEWNSLPSLDLLFDSHRKVCEVMLEINEEFSAALEEYTDILSEWHSAQSESYTGEGNIDSVLEEMGGLLFANPDHSDKNYGSN